MNAIAPEPHHLIFAYLEKRHWADFHNVLLAEPERSRAEFFLSKITSEGDVVITPDILREWLSILETKMDEKLRCHSPFFWLYLYRRIRPALHPGHSNKTDEVTASLVRELAELAMLKFGDVSMASDICRTSQIAFAKSWGGYLERAIEAFPAKNREDLRTILMRDYEENDTFIPSTFKSTDYRDVYAIEGLAYQYWLAMAQLRSVGKGSRLILHSDSRLGYEPNAELAEAIFRYDRRLGEKRFFSTMIGVVSQAAAETEAIRSLLLLTYNVSGIDVAPILKGMKLDVRSVTGDPIANFVPTFLDIQSFSAAHSYLDPEFIEKWGFSVSDLGYILWSLSNLALLPQRYLSDPEQSLGIFLLRLLKRGYIIYSTSGPDTWSGLRERLALFLELPSERLDSIMEKVPAIVEMISLDRPKQQQMSLWSRGPRAIILPYGEFLIIDVVGITTFLQRLFTGIRDDGKVRGQLFEEMVRNTLVDVLPQDWEVGRRLLRLDGQLKHEVDAMLIDGDRAYVCECFTMWLPLKIDVGDEQAINIRTKRIDEKLDQANAVCEFLRANPVGDNYDFSTIKDLIPVVISPFSEWLPLTSARYWLADNVPRVMSAEEFFEFIQNGGVT